jgi:hypothetical protein
MKTVLVGGLTARVARRILAKATERLDTIIVAGETDAKRLIPALAEPDDLRGPHG